jgi:DNA-3-methyladenine glycosylase II
MKSYKEVLQYLEKDKVLTNAIKGVSHEIKPELDIDVYRALLNSIVSQQLSVKVVDIIWRRFADLFVNGYPKAKELLAMEDNLLRNAGLSRAKAQYLKNVAAFSLENDMSFDYLYQKTDEEIIDYLTTIKGVGKWTVQMILMFPMDRLNVFPVDDLGIQQRMISLYNIDVEKKVLKPTLTEIAESWQPYSSLACKYLWKMEK